MTKVTFRDKIEIDYPKETALVDVAKDFSNHFNYPILVGRLNNYIVHLSKTISRKCDVDFYDRSSSVGHRIYSSSLQFILILAVRRLYGKDVDVHIEHSIDRGIYCELHGEDLNEKMADEIEQEMKKVVRENLPFNRVSVSRLDAIQYFNKEGMQDKVDVLKYISNSYVNLYCLDGLYDYFFGELAYSTKDIDDFKLNYIRNNGFVISYPSTKNPECTLDYVHYDKVYDKFLEYTRWGEEVGIVNAANLNHKVSIGEYSEIIRLAEANYASQLTRVSDIIKQKGNDIKIVLIAGPSSSGKTTTARKLEVFLGINGFKTHSISLDNYYKEHDETPINENGEYDFESIKALDLDLFNKQLSKLLDGERVLLPEYNFISGKKEYKNNWLQIKDKDIIIIEGLHALNDELTLSVERRNKFKIYVSPLTQLNIDNHNRISTGDARKLRRMVRDSKFRGYPAANTLKMWDNIKRGEEDYIFPFQNDSDYVVNSALLYEIGVLKVYAEPVLFSVTEDDEAYPEAIRLINFLRNFLPIPSDEVPCDSLLREFIGGSCFK